MPFETPKEAPANIKERLKATYDEIAPKYNDWTARHDHYRLNYLDTLIQTCPKLVDQAASPRVVELGCGQGKPFLNTLLSKQGPGATAVANDMSDTQLGFARENLAAYGERVTFVARDMTALDHADGSVSAVVALYSIFHLPSEQQKTMMERISRWLEPGGCLLFNVPLDKTEHTVMDGWLHEKGWVYFSGLGQKATSERLKELGLSVEVEKVESDEQETFAWIVAQKA